jgi:uncharacterized protein YukE
LLNEDICSTDAKDEVTYGTSEKIAAMNQKLSKEYQKVDGLFSGSADKRFGDKLIRGA